MTKKAQEKKMEQIAKDIRRGYWVSGYDDVSSTTHFLNKEMLDDNMENNKLAENTLSKPEISKLYKCYHQKTCELYLVSLWADYHAGTGNDHYYVLLYTKSQKHFKITHTVYAE